MTFLLDLLKAAVQKSPTRLVGYGSALAIALAVWVAAQLHVTVPPELLLLIGGMGAAVVTEAIRRLVYSPATVQKLADQATYLPAGTPVDIGKPPDASPPLPETPADDGRG